MPLRITSPQNARIKQAARLRDRRGRAQQDRIIIDGVREVRRAIDGGIDVTELFVCPDLCDERDVSAVFDPHDQRWIEIPSPVYEKLAFGNRSDGVVAVARTPQKRLADLVLPANPLVGVLVGIEKPGNVGAIIRSADAAGVSAVIVADGGTDLFNPNAIRASLGAIFSLPVCAAAGDEVRAWLRRRELAVYAARVDGAVDYLSADFRRPAAIILGSEAHGLSDSWTDPSVTAVKLPLCGTVDSLNVSTTAAVLFYEARRQRAENNIN